MATSGRTDSEFAVTLGPIWRWLALLPALTVVAALVLYPLGVAIGQSLAGDDGISARRYLAFFSNPASYLALWRTLLLALLATLGSIALSLPLAYLVRRHARASTLIGILVTVPLAVPVLIAAYALTLFFSEHGLFNLLLTRVLHVVAEPLQISYSLTGLVIACVWRFFPYTALVVIAALAALDPRLEEAAYSTGARPHQVLLRVTLPLLAPAILTGSVLTFVGTFGTFSIPLIMGRGQDVLSVMAYRQAATFLDWGSAATIVVIMAAVQLALLGAMRRAVRRPG